MDWDRIQRYSQRAGKEVLAFAEACYLTMCDPNISFRQKGLMIGALVYLLSPIDALPDFIPGGFSDDLSIMLTALVATGQIGRHHLKQSRIKYGIIERDGTPKKGK